MIDPRVEELLEQLYLCDVEGDASRSASPAADILALARSLGYVGAKGDRPCLTGPGRAIAGEVVRRHRLAERMLQDVLAVGADELEPDACRFEHILQPSLVEKICVLLGHPATCPHGKPIPPGPCCAHARHDAIVEVRPLAHGKAGEAGTVAFLSTRDQREVQKLMAMGVLPGEEIRLVRRFPSFVFQMGFSQFTVDRQLAEHIMVHWGNIQPANPSHS